MAIFFKISEHAKETIEETNAVITTLDTVGLSAVPEKGDLLAFPCDGGVIQFEIAKRVFDLSEDGDITLVLELLGIDDTKS